MDSGKTTALVLLDSSAALDTLDHSSIIGPLSGRYGISGTALNWVRSYLSTECRGINVWINLRNCSRRTTVSPPPMALSWGHSYSLYIQSLSSEICRHNICHHHMYANDTQIYLCLSKTDSEMSLSLVRKCLQDASDWMITSKLKLNSDKTKFILIGTKSQWEQIKKYFPTKLLDQDVTTDSAQNLGVVFDNDFNFTKHISNGFAHATIIYIYPIYVAHADV